jgi:hypothetical protein
MKRFVAAPLTLMILLTASSVCGETPPYNKHLEPLLPVMGNWLTEITLEQDMPGVGSTGETIAFLGMYKWTANRNAITLTVETNVGGKAVNVTNGLIVWDAQNKRITGLDAYVDGGILQYEIQVHEGKIVLRGHGATGDGLKTETTVEYRDITKDAITGQFINLKKGDEKLPDGKPYLLTRVRE